MSQNLPKPTHRFKCVKDPPLIRPHIVITSSRPPDRRVQATVMEQSVESVMCASERVSDAPDAPEMVRRARLLGQATARLIADIKVHLLACLILIS